MRYAILILLVCFTWGAPPLNVADLMRNDISGRQWLAHDLEERRAVVLQLRDQVVAGDQGSLKKFAEIIAREQDQELSECVDRSQEVCDRDKAIRAKDLIGLCKGFKVDECPEVYLHRHAIIAAYLLLAELNALNCAFQLEALDRAAQSDAESPVVLRALESCGWIARITIR